MKKIFLTTIAIVIVIFTSAQPNPHKNGDGSTVGGEPIGGYAPVGGGVTIMTLMVAGWATLKVLKKKEADPNSF